jgi:hypothetical protein
MKFILAAILLSSFTAKASPLMNTKESLRLHLWTYGLEGKTTKKKVQFRNPEKLPEEIDRPLRKI